MEINTFTEIREEIAIPNEMLLSLVSALFELDGSIRFNWLGSPDAEKPEMEEAMSPEVKMVTEKLDAINRVLILYGVTDANGEFLLMPNNKELEDQIRDMSDVYETTF